MPKMKADPATQALADEIAARNDGARMLTLTSVGNEIGLKNRTRIAAWLEDVPAVRVNGRKRWTATAIAKKIINSTTEV